MGHTPHVPQTCHRKEDQVRKPQGQGHEPICKVPRSSLRCTGFSGSTNPSRAGTCNGYLGGRTLRSSQCPLEASTKPLLSLQSHVRNHAEFGRPTVFTLCVKAEPPFRAAGAIHLEASLRPFPSRKGCAWPKGSGFRGPPMSPSWSCLQSSPRLTCASSLGSQPESMTFTNLLKGKRTKMVFPQRQGQKAGEEHGPHRNNRESPWPVMWGCWGVGGGGVARLGVPDESGEKVSPVILFFQSNPPV